MSPEEIQNLYRQRNEELNQRIAQAPEPVNTASDPEIAQYRTQYSSKIKELFDHDRVLATRSSYFQPGPAPGPHSTGPTATAEMTQPSLQILDPMVNATASANRTQAVAGELGDILSKIGERKDMLEDAYEKGIRIYQIGLEAKKQELAGLSDLFSMASKLRDQQMAAEEKRTTKGEGDRKKRVYTEAYAWFSSNPSEIEKDISILMSRYPQDGDVIAQAARDAKETSPAKEATFDYSNENVESGVAGKPVKEPYVSQKKKWLEAKRKREEGGKKPAGVQELEAAQELLKGHPPKKSWWESAFGGSSQPVPQEKSGSATLKKDSLGIR